MFPETVSLLTKLTLWSDQQDRPHPPADVCYLKLAFPRARCGAFKGFDRTPWSRLVLCRVAYKRRAQMDHPKEFEPKKQVETEQTLFRFISPSIFVELYFCKIKSTNVFLLIITMDLRKESMVRRPCMLLYSMRIRNFYRCALLMWSESTSSRLNP